MSILTALGASPSNLTVPLTLATVAGSIGVAAGAAAGVAAGCSAVSSFLPHPASKTSPHIAGRPRIFIQVFVFIFSLSPQNWSLKENLFTGPVTSVPSRACAGWLRTARSARTAHGRRDTPLFFGREL